MSNATIRRGASAAGILAGGVAVLFAGACASPQEQSAPPSTADGADAPPAADAPAAPSEPVRFVLDNDGLPEWVVGVREDRSMWKCDPLLVDLDGDGDLDLAALPRLEPKGPRVWRNEANPDGTRRWIPWSDGLAWRTTSCGGGLAAEDMDGDGRKDLLIACHCKGIAIYRNLGLAGWEPMVEELNPQVPGFVDDEFERDMYLGAEDLAIGDVNGDGHTDLAWVSSDEGGMALFLGDGTGTNWTEYRPSVLPRRGWGLRIDLVDVDLDGDDDLACTTSDGPRVWLNDGTGTLTLAADGLPAPLTRGIYLGMEVTDMNDDGRPDIVVANWVDGPEVWLQQVADDGAISWTKRPDVFPEMFGGAISVAVDDLDGDGEKDIVTVGRLQTTGAWSRGVFALMGRGDGTYRWATDIGLPATGLSAVGGVSLADVNADGTPDVIIGAGLIVETDPDFPRPQVDPRLPVYTSRPVDRG